MRFRGEERGFGLFLLMAVRWRTVVNFFMRIQCHLIFPPSVPFTAKRMCNPVLLGYRWMGVLSPAEQQCQCWASWVHGSWLPFSWRRQSVVDHRRGVDIMFWHSSLLVTRFLVLSFFCLCLVRGLQSAFRSIPWAPSTHWSRQTVAGEHLTG